MNITLIMVGRTVAAYLESGITEYTKRLKHYIRLDMNIIPELKNAKNMREDQIRDTEGELILSRIEQSDYVVLLDEAGRLGSSEDMAAWMQGMMNRGTRRLIFVVGGAYGFSESVYRRANEKLSLSPMTFSHQMVRLIFVEQLYRAMTIIRGEPYHHR